MIEWFDNFKLIGVQRDIEKYYKIDKIIGKGGSAFVKLGIKIENEREYAIKLIIKANFIERTYAIVHSY